MASGAGLPGESHLAEPAGRPRGSVLVLAGSSGRVDTGRARLLAGRGWRALALQWFGGPGQPPGICEVPLETFTAALDRLAATPPVAIVGLSKGAEAALLVASLDPRVDVVLGISPSSVVWANIGKGLDGREAPPRSCWTWQGTPLPFVPYVAGPAEVDGLGRQVHEALYRRSLLAAPDAVAAAATPVERARGRVVLAAGGADLMWPSGLFCEQLAARRPDVVQVAEPEAGHRPVLPGEDEPAPSTVHAHGGTPTADRALGAAALAAFEEAMARA